MNSRHRSLLAIEKEDRTLSTRWKKMWRCHVKPFWRNNQWLVMISLWVLTLILGFTGFAKNRASTGQEATFWDICYLTLQLFVMESGSVHSLHWELDVARFMAPLVAALTAVQAIALLFHEQMQMLSMRFLSGHAIVCGLGRKGLLIAEEFKRRGYQVVGIENDTSSANIRHCREEGIIVLTGSARDEALLMRSNSRNAIYLVAATGDDTVNIDIASLAWGTALKRRRKALNTIIHIINPRLCVMLKEHELAHSYESLFRLQFFNIYETGARILMERHFPPSWQAAAPHLVIAGDGELGAFAVIEAARRWKQISPDVKERLNVTLAGAAASERHDLLVGRYPSLERFCLFKTINAPIISAFFEKAEFLEEGEKGSSADAVFFCHDDDSETVPAALTLLHRLRGQACPVIVQTSSREGLASFLMAGGRTVAAGELSFFSPSDEACSFDFLLGGTNEIIARAMHAEYLRNRQAQGLTEKDRRSLAPWDDLPEHVREWTRRQADHIGEKLDAIGCSITPLLDLDEEPLIFDEEETAMLVKMERERFVGERRAEGWTDGPLDPAKKISPHLGAWESLPPDIQEYVRDSVKRIPAFLAEAGFSIYRRAGRKTK
ncbi:MAG: NAD-binding protein [Candidatus Eremiobacteraeota bacterium]|nr:NAD-binding protein [Candidatus Eremiobacteraeota bacterium]